MASIQSVATAASGSSKFGPTLKPLCTHSLSGVQPVAIMARTASKAGPPRMTARTDRAATGWLIQTSSMS